MSVYPVPLTRVTAFALAIGVTLGSLGSNVMPVLLSGVIETRHLTNTAAGGVATAQLLATALVVLGLTTRAGRPGRVVLARWGLIAAATGFAASIAAPTGLTLGLTNVLAGAGMGVIGAMALAGLPSTDDPDRATKITVLINVTGVAVMVAAIAAVNGAWGPGGGFALLAVVCLAVVPLAGRLPDPPMVTAEAGLHLGDLPRKVVGAALCAGAAVFAATDLGLWAHAETLGRKHAGLDETAIVVVLAIGVLAGLAGVLAAAWMVGRWRHLWPLAGFLVLGGSLKVLLAVTTSPVVFAVAIAVWNTTYPAVVLLLLTIAAGLDERGRWNTALGGAIGLGTAIGPLISGVALDQSHLALGLTLGGGALLATLLLTPVARITARPVGGAALSDARTAS